MIWRSEDSGPGGQFKMMRVKPAPTCDPNWSSLSRARESAFFPRP